MRNIRIVLQYEGTRYAGFQRLTGSGKTIQGKIESVLTEICGEPIEVIGSGRTDAGVHAESQTVNFKTSSPVPAKDMVTLCNRYLPQDIVVKEAREVPERFHARYHAVSKTYVYRILNRDIPDAFLYRTTYHEARFLELEAMNAAGSVLAGTHDFHAFTNDKNRKKDKIRTMDRISAERDGDLVLITMKGNGFLYNMARIIAGTLIEVGLGRLSPYDVKAVLEGGDRVSAGFLAPAHGLILAAVDYEPS